MYFGLKTYLFKVLHIFIILFYKVGKSQGKEIHLKPVFLKVNLMKMLGQVATDIEKKGKAFQTAQLTPAKYCFDLCTIELSQS